MPNIRDARSAVLKAEANVQKWSEEWQAKWTQPDAEAGMILFWQSIPPEVKEQLRMIIPDAAERFDQFISQLQEKQKWQS